MQFQLDLTLRQSEGALARVLGTTQRRGFAPTALRAEAHPDNGQWALRMTVESERSALALKPQLDKLHDCVCVEVLPCR